jgi:hypothetical protein
MIAWSTNVDDRKQRGASRGILSSPLLALLYDVAQIHNRPYFNRSKSILKAWLL